jgi:hypothetical protein
MPRRDAIPVITAAHGQTFAWGRADCFTFALDVVKAVAGADPYADERGRWTTRIGAARRLKARGYANLAEALAAVLPAQEPGRGVLGDVGVADGPEGPVAVVHDGNGWIARGAHGVVRVPVAAVTHAFKVI